jgi:hypothetical protein
MGCREATGASRVYRPRDPRKSPLYRCVTRHYGELDAAGKIRRQVEHEVLERFTDCGDLHKGFARIRCDQCGHDYLLAFSCKTRYFCPSCHQKRMLEYGEWVEEEVLAPVPHRQYVFTVPKMLRPHFHRRYRLGALCRIVARLLDRGYGAMANRRGRPGFILFVQTFGDLVNFHPHIHVLAADGVFAPGGVFRVLPSLPLAALEQAFREAVIEYLVKEGAIGEALAHQLLQWRYSGFSLDASVRIAADDAPGRRQLARYMIRNPFNHGKMDYRQTEGMVIYRSKMHVSLKRNFQLMPGAAWLRLLLDHVPDKGEHLVRYYGWYSNRARGERRKGEVEGAEDTGTIPAIEEAVTTDADDGFQAHARASWARQIRKAYEVDPLTCPNCGAQMRPIAIIEEPGVIERILRHVGAWSPLPASRGPPGRTDWPAEAQIPITYEPLPPIA